MKKKCTGGGGGDLLLLKWPHSLRFSLRRSILADEL